MLLIILAVCLLISLLVVLWRKDSLSFFLLGMSLSNCIMLAGVIVYIAQQGGLPTRQISLFFLNKDIRDYLRFLPVSMDKLGYVVAFGRTLFPLFALWVALDSSMIPWVRRQTTLRRASPVPTLLLLVYYFPSVFRSLTARNFNLMIVMMQVSFAYTVVYLLLAVALLVVEMFSITISFYRKKSSHLLLSVVGIGLLYILYATKDPTQIYNLYVSEYIQYGISSYIGPMLSSRGWMAVAVTSLCAMVVGSYGLLYYTKMDYNEEQQDLSLQRKFNMAGNGVTVFIHGIKNQLLTSRVLYKKLDRALNTQEPDLQAAREISQQLHALNEGMITRLNELNQSMKNNALVLVPVPVSGVIRGAVKRFGEKYPENAVEVLGESQRRVLADMPQLVEAVYNLLINGYEAAVQHGVENPKVTLRLEQERLWTVLEIRDNGPGIPVSQLEKIFEPFYTSKKAGPNWGMGLYYTQRIIKGHFGKLRLESNNGKGASFYVMLPRYDTGR